MCVGSAMSVGIFWGSISSLFPLSKVFKKIVWFGDFRGVFGGLHFRLISFSKFPNSFFSKRSRIASVVFLVEGNPFYLCVLTCVLLMEAGCGGSGRVTASRVMG